MNCFRSNSEFGRGIQSSAIYMGFSGSPGLWVYVFINERNGDRSGRFILSLPSHLGYLPYMSIRAQ